MKHSCFSLTTITVFLSTLLYSCFAAREIQIDIQDVKLVKIDTVWRYHRGDMLKLTWRSVKSGTDFAYFMPAQQNPFNVGIRMQALVLR